MAACTLGIGPVEGDGAVALLGIAGSVDAPSVLVGELDEAGGLAFGLFADFLYTNFPFSEVSVKFNSGKAAAGRATTTRLRPARLAW